MTSFYKLKYDVEPYERTYYPDGINLIGYIRGEFGLGQSCRLLAGSIFESGVSFTIYNYEHISTVRFNDSTWDYKIKNKALYNINVVHIHPYEVPVAYSQLSKSICNKRYNIAFWLWESEVFPEQWINTINLFNEIWTPSEYASKSIRKVTNKPVITIPYGIGALGCGSYDRKHFHLPDNIFLFLCMYDCSSNFERKNPMASIRAYKEAFRDDEMNVGLVIKLNNSQKYDIELIQNETSEYSNIFIITDTLEKTEINALISCADAYISLHRAEGFGLIPAEAMMLKTPVIATNWSANTEFMDGSSACMVDYELSTLAKDYDFFQAGSRWAEPNIHHAAYYMRKLFEDDDFLDSIVENAYIHIKKNLSVEKAADLINKRVNEIYNI